MALHDKMLNFYYNKPLAKSTSTAIASRVVDNRFNGENVDNRVFVFAQLGVALADGKVTLKLQTSEDGSSWTDLRTWTNKGKALCAEPLPMGTKRYLRMTATNADTENDTSLWAELTDTVDIDHSRIRMNVSTARDVAAESDDVVNPAT